MADSLILGSVLVAPGIWSNTWLTGETALAVDLVRSPRRTLVAGGCNGRLRDQRHLSVTLSQHHTLRLRQFPFRGMNPCFSSSLAHIIHPRPVPLSRDDPLLFLVPCSSIFLTIFYPQPVPLPRDDSLLFLILCSSLSLRWPTPFPASRGMTSGLLTALCAKEEAARTSTPPFHSFCAHAFAALVFCRMSVMYSAQWRRLSCPCSIASALTGSGGDFTDCSDTSSPQVSLSTHGISEDRSRLRFKGGSVVLPGGGGSGLGFEDLGLEG
jgi:hypothetical protein